MGNLETQLRETARFDEVVIHALFDRSILAIAGHDAEGWMELWDEDGVQLPPDQDMHVGKAAIRDANFALFADTSRSWKLTIDVDELQLFEEGYAIARGLFDYQATPVDGGSSFAMDGKFMSILKKQPDGRWLLYRDCFNANRG